MSANRYTRDHEWVRQEGDVAVIGITDYAQSQLGDVVYVELPEIGRAIEQGREAAVVESAKAASEVYAPVSGEVVEVNGELLGNPAQGQRRRDGRWLVHQGTTGRPEGTRGLMDEAAYQAFVAEQE